MNEFHAIALDRLNRNAGRVPVFQEALKNIEHIESPWILEIGGFRGQYPEDVDGDGFSIFYWCEFLAKKGSGRLTIIDIDPIAIEKTKNVLSDFKGKFDIDFICTDGLEYLKALNKQNVHPSLIYLDGPESPEWFTYECFRLINRTQTAVLCDDANGWENGQGKCVRTRLNYPDYTLFKVGPIHEMIYYPLVQGNDKTFKFGSLELEYVRENSNAAWRNCRSVELALGKWFAEKFDNNILELGDVCPWVSFFKDWPVIDPFGPFVKAIRKSAEQFDYTERNLLSISTLEHLNNLEYNNNAPDLCITALKKIVAESANYLITTPIGGWILLDDYIKQSNLNYTFLVRDNPRGETNNWHSSNDKEVFSLSYGHFSELRGFYGDSSAICVITNQKEIYV